MKVLFILFLFEKLTLVKPVVEGVLYEHELHTDIQLLAASLWLNTSVSSVFFLVTSTSHQSNPPLAEENPAATSSASLAATARTDTVKQSRSRDRSRSRQRSAIAVSRSDGLTEGLLQYLDDGSCGFESERPCQLDQEASSARPVSESTEKAGEGHQRTTRFSQRGMATPKLMTASTTGVAEVLLCEEKEGDDVESSRGNKDGNNAKVCEMNRQVLFLIFYRLFLCCT